MDKQEDKKLEDFVDRIIRETSLESPSADFTKNLMQKIESERAREVFTYKPILPKPVLVGFFAAFVALMAYVILQYGSLDGTGWLDKVQWEPNFKPMWSWMEQYTSSKVLVYAVLLFGFLFFAQVPWLKKHLDRTALS
jgi:hypothetical protein